MTPNTKMPQFLKAPPFLFLIIGLCLFLVDAWVENNREKTIIINEGDIQRIQAQWRVQSGKEITPETLDALIEETIQERRLYQEALALNLDKDDVIIRRRLAQKLRFLNEDLFAGVETPKEELERFFQDHVTDYLRPARYTFNHIYFSSDQPASLSRAQKVLLDLSGTENAAKEWLNAGDPFMLGASFTDKSSPILARRFGAEFVVALEHQQTNTWVGPLESAYGLHLVYLSKITSSLTPNYADVQEQVLQDYLAEQRRTGFDEYLKSLANKYPAVIERSTTSSNNN